MNRSDFQRLSELRLSDARVLLDTGSNNEGAFYLAGYAVECALKACVVKNYGIYIDSLGDDPFPDFTQEKSKYFTHNLGVLLKTANIEAELDQEKQAQSPIYLSWSFVAGNWSEELRYQSYTSASQAEGLIEAIGDPTEGVLQWLQRYW